MLYLTCTMISSVDLARYGISRAKDWVSVDCGTSPFVVVYYWPVQFASPGKPVISIRDFISQHSLNKVKAN